MMLAGWLLLRWLDSVSWVGEAGGWLLFKLMERANRYAGGVPC